MQLRFRSHRRSFAVKMSSNLSLPQSRLCPTCADGEQSRVPAKRVKSVERAPAEPRQSRRDEVVESLAKVEGLAGLPLRKLYVLADRIVVRLFERHAVIYEESQSKAYMYVLLSGIARLTCLNRKGERILLEVLGPGDIVALPPLLTDARVHLRFGAFTDCRIGLLNPKTLVQHIMGLPFSNFRHALALTSGRWWQLLVCHSTFMEQSLKERVILALLDLGAKV